jgi:hypothetical protein
MSVPQKLTRKGRTVVLALAALLVVSCAPKPSKVDLAAILRQPQLFNDKNIQVTACIKQFHHGVLLDRCGAESYKTVLFSDDLREDQRQAFRDAATKTYLGKGSAHCLTGRFRFVAGKTSDQWLELREFSANPCP